MKNLYLCWILLAWTLCLPSFLSAQSDGANRIAAIRARLDTLTLRDEAYLGEVDLSVGEAPLSELLRSVAQVGGVNLSVRDGANLTVELQLHAGPHRRAAAVSVRAVRTGRADHREYRLRLSVRSACRSAARTVGAVRPLRLDAQLRPDRRAAARGGPAHHRQHGREPDRPADAVRTARIGLHRSNAFRRGARLAGRDQQTGGYPRQGQRGLGVFRAAGRNGKPGRPAPNYVRRRQFAPAQLSVDSTGRITAMIDRGNVYDIILDVCEQLKLDYFFITPVNAQTSIYLKNTDAKTLFDLLLTGTAYTYYEEGGVYMFGEAKREGLFSTRIVPMRYRTVDKLAEAIPDNLKKGVQTAAFGDLNSMILSGDQRQVARIEQFLRSIDRTVPLITIEVMIVDASKDVLLEAGLGLGLGTEPTQTSGTLCPGLDMTLGAGAVNSLANQVGLVKLGKVTPNFYASLKAMEQDGTIELRSTPRLSTLNGREAVLTSGEMQYYKETNNTYMGTQNPVQSTSYVWKSVEANMTLSITPYVSEDGHISMTIDLSQSEFTDRTEKEAPPGTTTRSFRSMVRVKNEETVLLGGIDRQSREKSSQGLPFIARVPVLKWIFGTHKNNKQERRLNVFIKPTVVE